MKNLIGVSEFKFIRTLCLISIILEAGLAFILGIGYFLLFIGLQVNFIPDLNPANAVAVVLLPLNILMQFCFCVLYFLVYTEVQKYWKLLVIFFYYNIIRIILVVTTIYYYKQNPVYYTIPVLFLIFNIFLFMGIYREGFIRRRKTI